MCSPVGAEQRDQPSIFQNESGGAELSTAENKLRGDAGWLLAGDIGGTKTVLALYAPEGGPHQPVAKETFASAEYESLETLVAAFLQDRPAPLRRASFGIAGPLINDRIKATNLPWVVDAQTCSVQLGAPVHLLNDLVAVAHAVPFLNADDLETLNVGNPKPHAPLAVIAPGTGLGEAFLTWAGGAYIAFASEGGHADFAPNSPIERELLTSLSTRLDHVSYEDVCSGRGLPNLYDFLHDSGRYEEPAWLALELSKAPDRTRVIVRAAVEEQAAICVATLTLFRDILAAEAGNLALKVLATGGVYLGGGPPPRLMRFLHADDFTQSFANKGRFSAKMREIPVHVIRNPEAALLGAACYGLEMDRRDA